MEKVRKAHQDQVEDQGQEVKEDLLVQMDFLVLMVKLDLLVKEGYKVHPDLQALQVNLVKEEKKEAQDNLDQEDHQVYKERQV